MPREKEFTAEQIIGMLLDAEVHFTEGKTVAEAARKFLLNRVGLEIGVAELR